MSGEVIIHIVDDEEPVRRSLAFLLTMSGYAVRVHESATAFLAVAREIGKACLVTDLRMPDMSGVELLRRLQEVDAMLPTIVITGHADVPMAVEAMKAGAIDFIEKPFEEEMLLAALGRAKQDLERRSHDRGDAAAVRERMKALSQREAQVLEGIVAGLPNKTIAYDLDISPRTVEVHRASVMAKMQAKNLPELVRMVMSMDEGAPPA